MICKVFQFSFARTNRRLSQLLLTTCLLLPSFSSAFVPEENNPLTQLTIKKTITENIATNSSAVEPAIQSSSLPHNLSPFGMFMAADWVVKTVMIGLILASLLTWTILVSKSIELAALKNLLRGNLCHLSEVSSLREAANIAAIRGAGRECIQAAEKELLLSAGMAQRDGGKEGIKERAASSLLRIETASSRSMLVGTGLLATIGSVAPFVGLFGTVWGIMNSFIGISQSNTTSLAVVAPGIAEALLATAFGLVAAIPAVIIYNHFTRQIAATKALVSDGSASIMRLLSRDLDRSSTPLFPSSYFFC